MISIAILLTVHNRKQKTISCLDAIRSQSGCQEYKIDIFLTDDGCTDGTKEAVQSLFPDIFIIPANGTLFWNRGMREAWSVAASHFDYDFYLWLNDDTCLNDDAISTLIETSKIKSNGVVVGPTCKSNSSDVTTYSGFDSNNEIITPNGAIQTCYVFNGNIVLVPKIVFKTVGNLDRYYHHALGDLDYGHMVRKAGFNNYVASKFCGVCEKNPKLPAWVRPEVPLLKRLRNYYSPLAYGEPKTLFHYNKKNYGIMHAIRVLITNHIRVFFPRLKIR